MWYRHLNQATVVWILGIEYLQYQVMKAVNPVNDSLVLEIQAVEAPVVAESL